MSKEITMNNIPCVSVGDLKKYLSAVYSTLILTEQPIHLLPAPMLWGPPGIGKSQLVHQVAEEIEKNTGKKTTVTDVRLLLFNPIDLRGIPVANEEKTLAVWLKPKIFQMDEGKDAVNILFLDEISAAPPSVQAAAYQITLDRVIGEHKLPDNCIVIAAGNRTTDKSVSYKMPKALANRLMHFEISANFQSWKEWALEKGIHEKIIGFLSFRQNYFMNFDAGTEDLAFATPRTWEFASNILNCVSDNLEIVYPFLAASLGTGIALEFRSWMNIYKNLPRIEDIFQGKNPSIPKNTDALYALISSMATYAREHKEDYKQIVNSVLYAMRLPVDFSVTLMRDYLHLDNKFREMLFKMPEFSSWRRYCGGALNGIL